MFNYCSPVRTILIYILFCIIWILSTNALLQWWYHNLSRNMWLGYGIKGALFIIISATVLYRLLQKHKAALLRSEEAYVRIFQTNPSPMWIFQSDNYCFVEVNEAALNAYGYTREEFNKLKLPDLHPAESPGLYPESDFMNGYRPAGVWQHLKKDGSVMYVEVQSFCTEYQGQSVIVASLNDITDKHIANQALAKQQQLLGTIINSTSDVIWAVDTNLQYIAFNNAFKNSIELLTGMKVEENDPLAWIKTDAAYEKWKHCYECCLMGQKQVIEEVRELKDIGNVHVETTMDPIVNDGAIIGVACIAHNVTERKEHELVLKKMLERYDLVNLATNDVIWDWDLASNSINWNQNMQLLFGHTEADQKLSWWKQQVHPEDLANVAGILNDTLRQGKRSWKTEYRFRHADGCYRQVNDRGYILYGNNGAPVRMIGSIQDVEDKKQYIEHLKKVVFLCSHSLRRPVANMLCIISLLNKENFSDPENKSLLELIEKVALEMDSILHEVVKKGTQISQYPGINRSASGHTLPSSM